jgi:hypothetical protein
VVDIGVVILDRPLRRVIIDGADETARVLNRAERHDIFRTQAARAHREGTRGLA